MARAVRTHEMPVKVEEGEGGAVPNFRPRLRYKGEDTFWWYQSVFQSIALGMNIIIINIEAHEQSLLL